ncbi:MAG: hypothetical protein M3143_02560, partial [Actinomycetota bacterium]|nr:hypothetical protein [Actinomycetota bacterium]
MIGEPGRWIRRECHHDLSSRRIIVTPWLNNRTAEFAWENDQRRLVLARAAAPDRQGPAAEELILGIGSVAARSEPGRPIWPRCVDRPRRHAAGQARFQG